MTTRWRVVFIGQNRDYSLASLQAVAAAHDVVGVVESAPRGMTEEQERSWKRRGERLVKRWLGRPLLSVFAKRRGVPYFFLTRENREKLIPWLERLRPDVGCVASMSQLLPERVLQVPTHGFFNVHPSLLPQYRGPNPWFWQYYDGAEESGVTVHLLDAGEDTGDIVKQAAFAVPLGLDPQAFLEQSTQLGARLLVEALDDLAAGRLQRRPQREQPCPRRARNLQSGESFPEWRTWPLPRAYHLLCGASYWQESMLPPAGRGYAWRVQGYEEENGAGLVDEKECYVSHPQGTIRLRQVFSFTRWLQAMLARR